ncbi:facilitated trehalose transporter Tret1 isoform X2 [Ptiloglossa arizonensis]|uniref:facilitated trehalose transporter Tret1 isoform X2 n=1 Tax=Ptiloglossa arizonensis TaxID=3350558 RepID=UPI003FA032FA
MNSCFISTFDSGCVIFNMGNKMNRATATSDVIIEEIPSRQDEQEKEAKPTKNENKSKIYPQVVAGIIVNLSLLACGICFAWPTPVLYLNAQKDTITTLQLNKNREILIVAAVSIGGCVGSIISALLLDKIGRKWLLYSTGVPFLVCWACTYMSVLVSKTWILIFVGRLVAGLSVGVIFTMVPVYIGEIVEAKIRGAIATMMASSLNMGYLIVYAIGSHVDMKMLTLACLAPTVVFGLTLAWLPESPYYYMKNKKEKQAEIALVWLRRRKENGEELKEISELIEREKNGCFKELFTEQVNRKALLLVLLLLTGQLLSGLIIQFYAKSLITYMHLPISANNVFIAFGLLSVVMSLVSIFIMDRIGRKPLFLIAGYISGLCLCFLGAYFFLNKKYLNLDKYSWTPLAATAVYYVVTFIGLSPMPGVVSSEIFSIKMKSRATMVTNIFGFLLGSLAIIIVMILNPVMDLHGHYAIFFSFGILELIIATVAAFIMPETKLKSFIEIQNILQKPIPECNLKEEHETNEIYETREKHARNVNFNLDAEEKQ